MSKLIEVLSTTKHKNVKVGAANGTGYFYAGSVDNFMNNIDRVNRACHMAAERDIEQRKARFERLCAEYPTVEKFARKYGLSKKREMLTAENYMKLLDEHLERVRIASEAWEKSEDILAKFKPMSERDAVRYDDSIVDDDCVNVIIEGYEFGKYWALDEVAPGAEVGFTLACEEDEGKEKRQVA